ncbi:uncharacterized protein PRCAT00003647001 [Priceomyces carsonii]|uniref:uncharacterized protein n=1 Tax=Priceomyces carsonii TaxID=28549 RepID=UPI002EDBA930|nr:unnamed protein product [Priceomyces carsonii]
MARKNPKKAVPQEDFGLNEVDSLHANQDKILLNAAGEYGLRHMENDSSEEEVLNIKEMDFDDNSDEEIASEDKSLVGSEKEADEDEDEEGWGARQNYYGGEDDSDDEDIKQMTEEAIRQQKKHLQELALDDYVDDDLVEKWQKTGNTYDEKASAPQKIFEINKSSGLENLDDSERLNILNSCFPEFSPLLEELNELMPILENLKKGEKNRLYKIKSDALSAYLGAVTGYFSIFVERLNSVESFTSMKGEPIMEAILSSREVWRQAEELSESPSKNKFASEHNQDIEEHTYELKQTSLSDLSESEHDLEDSDGEIGATIKNNEFNIDINSKRELKRRNQTVPEDDYTEVAAPEDVDMEEKQRRKRTLRFYTSKIDQAASKNKDRYSGDTDLPYRERLFERQQKLIEDARKRGLGEDPASRGQDIDSLSDNSDHLSEGDRNSQNTYEAIRKQKDEKKKSRQDAHVAAARALKEGKLEELREVVGEDGKRAINYQILKNKGLTPHRKKENRNSRVKKRNKYEKAQKKLKSVRQVYDASKNGPYEGEKTGIKKGLSRSVRLV